MRVQKLGQENTSLKNRIISQEKSQQKLLQKNKVLINSIGNLKDLATSLLKDAGRVNQNSKILQQLEFQSASEEEYNPLVEQDKNAIILKNEIQRLRIDIKGKSMEYEALYNQLSDLEQKIQKEEVNKLTREKNYKERITQLNNQLTGAIRRINYLIGEKHKQDNKKHSPYIMKLEMKCKEMTEGLLKEDKSLSNIKRTFRNSINKSLTSRESSKKDII